MTRKLLPLAILSLFCESQTLAEPLEAPFLKAGFRCSNTESSTICNIQKVSTEGFQYPKPIVVSLPSNTSARGVFLYLHGHRGVCERNDISPTEFVNQYKLPQQTAFRGLIGIFPMSSGKCETYEASLVPNFDRFHQWIVSLIPQQEFSWILAGHSGAGRHMARIAGSKKYLTTKLESAFLLDATYGMWNYIPLWKRATEMNQRLKIFATTVGEGTTRTGALDLERSLGESKADAQRSKANSHCTVPNLDVSSLLDQISK